MNIGRFGKLSKFDKLITNNSSIIFNSSEETLKKEQKKVLNFYERVCKRNILNSNIFKDLKEKNSYLKNADPSEGNKIKILDNKKGHNESFLHRLFYSYDTYIKCFKEDPNTLIYEFQGNKELTIKNKREYAVEKQIITNYARNSVDFYANDPFPNDKFRFLFEFFKFLCTSLTDLIRINQLEFETRYNILFRLIAEFKKYIESVNVNEIIKYEYETFGFPKFHIDVVEYICKTVGLF